MINNANKYKAIIEAYYFEDGNPIVKRVDNLDNYIDISELRECEYRYVGIDQAITSQKKSWAVEFTKNGENICLWIDPKTGFIYILESANASILFTYWVKY